VQNLTSYSCSASPISYKGDEISHVSRLVIEIRSDAGQTDEGQTDRRPKQKALTL